MVIIMAIIQRSHCHFFDYPTRPPLYDFAVERLRSRLQARSTIEITSQSEYLQQLDSLKKSVGLNRYDKAFETISMQWDGNWIVIDYPDVGWNNPTSEGRVMAARSAIKLYKEIEPYREKIESLAKWDDEHIKFGTEKPLWGAICIIRFYEKEIRPQLDILGLDDNIEGIIPPQIGNQPKIRVKETRLFADVYNKLVMYFDGIAPKKDVKEYVKKNPNVDWLDLETIKVLDEDGTISLPVLELQITCEDFCEKRLLWEAELKENIQNYSDNLNVDMLRNNFSWGIMPTTKMLLDVCLFTEAALLDKLLETHSFIENLISYNSIDGTYGISEYKESIKESVKVLPNGTKKKDTGKKRDANFMDCIQYPDKEKLIRRIHELIDGKSGADVGYVFLRLVAIDHYLSRNPTVNEMKQEFPNIVWNSSITNYLTESSKVCNSKLIKANQIVIFE